MDPLIIVPIVSAIASAATAVVGLVRRNQVTAALPSVIVRRPDGEEVVIDSFTDSPQQREDLEEALHAEGSATQAERAKARSA